MKFSKGVTIEQIENVINWILADMKKEQLEAREAYKADTKDIFHGYMDTMYGFVEDMIRSRLSILCDEQERDLYRQLIKRGIENVRTTYDLGGDQTSVSSSECRAGRYS